LLAASVLPAVPAGADISVDLGRGPVNVNVPAGYDPGVPAPLVILLHGFTSSGAGTEAYLQFTPLSEEFGFLFAHPDGTVNGTGQRFWNATPACCGFGSTVDDSGYLRSLVDEIKIQLNVDPDRVWFAGHSNGGFMSYRMACDHADAVAAIASFAGATYDDPLDCAPTNPVHVLQLHGTNDATILYNGGNLVGNPYPGAVQSAETWATYNGCTLVTDTSLPPLDMVATIAGAETSVTRYIDGCSGAEAELWTSAGGGHVPTISATFSRSIIEWFYAHPRAGSAVDAPPSVTAAAGTGLELRAPAPNPTRGASTLSWYQPRTAGADLAIYDVRGRKVRQLFVDVAAAGSHAVLWDGTDREARAVAPGTYFARIAAAGDVRTVKIQVASR
ncbi:MAG: T9SS type A sorting domain-containing protein, partial [Gemmatimonadetes bacterium]|nr:T9SS type A sorting domain-containing protein [Gemmatimonadota bacterium]